MVTNQLNWPTTSKGIRRREVTRFRRPTYRRSRFEALEQRQLLTVAPQLEGLGDVEVAAGGTYQIALTATDDGDSLSYSATVDNADVIGGALSTYIPSGNRSMRMTVENFGTMTFEMFEQRVGKATGELIDRINANVFDSTAIHRVGTLANGEPFMFQGGASGTGERFDDQFHPDLRHSNAGVLAMANGGADTNDAQVYVTGGDVGFLDHRYTIVGFLTSGEDIRQEIQSVETELQDPDDPDSEKSKPLEDITIESVEIFVDPLRGTMTLIAPEGASGEAEVTVTVTDDEGKTDAETFTVAIVDPPGTYNSPPYMEEIADVHTVAGGEAHFQIPTSQGDDDTISYDGVVIDQDDDIGLTVDPVTGEVWVAPTAEAAGVYGIFVGVRDDSSNWDTQAVPVFVEPNAPTAVDLLASSDTGAATDDGLTNLNNDGTNRLSFRVAGTLTGAQVTLLASGQVIGTAQANGNNAVIVTDGNLTLDDGPHSITAYQTLADQDYEIGNRQGTADLVSEQSPALEIQVDTGVPQFANQPTLGATEGVQYVYDAQTDDETAGENVEYSLTQSPAGMIVDHSTGRITWTPQAGQGPTRDVVLVVEDAAGNRNQRSFTIEINEAPVLDPIGEQQVDELAKLTFIAFATDDGGDVTYSLADGSPEGAAIDPDSGVFTWTPAEAHGPGEYEVTVLATDDTGLIDSETINIAVDEVNVPPEFPDDDVNWTIDEGELLQWQPEVQDPDLPAADLTFALEGDVPDDLIFDPDTGEISWEPDELAGGGIFDMTLRVDDDSGGIDEQTLHITVNEVDRPPTVEVPPRFVLPGESVSVPVTAADPDTPTNALRFELEGDRPDGMDIDEITGEITWDVPEDFEPGQVTVGVRVTEQISGGLSSATWVVIQVVDPRVLILEAALGEGDFETLLSSGTRLASETDPMLKEAPLGDGAATDSSAVAAGLLPRLTLEDTGMFGMQIGPFTPSGRTGIPEVNGKAGSEAGNGEAEDADTSARQPGDDYDGRATGSLRIQPEAADLVLGEEPDGGPYDSRE